MILKRILNIKYWNVIEHFFIKGNFILFIYSSNVYGFLLDFLFICFSVVLFEFFIKVRVI